MNGTTLHTHGNIYKYIQAYMQTIIHIDTFNCMLWNALSGPQMHESVKNTKIIKTPSNKTVTTL